MDELRKLAKEQGFDVLDPKFPSYLDSVDPLKSFRDKFHIPKGPGGSEAIYFCGNSLGPQPKECRNEMEKVLKTWELEAVEAWETKWIKSEGGLKECTQMMSKIVGAKEKEITLMNSLTINLHLMLTHFYNPTSKRYKILMDKNGFPSDRIAVSDHLRLRGYDPKEAIIHPEDDNEDEETSILKILEHKGSEIALVWLEGCHYLYGRARNIKKITEVAHSHNCTVGFDLAHAVGNLKLDLHSSNIDFAVWCTYKYLCSGPGGIGALFVHEKHLGQPLNRLGGWWGQPPETRFQMNPDNPMHPFAQGFHVSTQNMLSLASLKAGLSIYNEMGGMDKFRKKSRLLTAYLELLLKNIKRVKILTPTHAEKRGCQLTLAFEEPFHGKDVLKTMSEKEGIICDFREPNCLRVAPQPLFNTFAEVNKFVHILTRVLEQQK